MGLGRFGGGLGVTRWLLDQGAQVKVVDCSDEESLIDSIVKLKAHPQAGNLELEFGEHHHAQLDGVDLIVVNPAVPRPWDNALLKEALNRNIKLTTEIEIVYSFLNPQQIIAITGSAGKSTTSAMTHHILDQLGLDTVLGGNIGGSLLDSLVSIHTDTYVVLELSSVMIYWLWGRHTDHQSSMRLHAPRCVCLTSFSENHIDWHGDLEHYRSMKQALLKVLPEESHAILHESLSSWGALTSGTVHSLSDKDLVHGCRALGDHNAMNAAMGISCVELMLGDSNRDQMVQAVRDFPGLEHRLHRCHSSNGIEFVNDSKSTIPQASVLAVDSIAQQVSKNTIHLICGGYDKGVSLDPIIQMIPDLKGVYGIGTTAGVVVGSGYSNAISCQSLTNAVNSVMQRADPGDTVLLSPGCASWDQFENYEQRGQQFIELVKSYGS